MATIPVVPTHIASRISSIRTSPILAVSTRCAQLKRKGYDIVDLSIGEPDFDTSSHIVEAAHAAALRGETRYSPLTGTAELKEAIISKVARDQHMGISPDEIIVSTGAKQVLCNAFLATVDEGDEVIIAAPYWTSYPDMISFAGGRPVIIETAALTGWKITAETLEAAITPATRWVLFNSPSNPTGAVYSREELIALAEVIAHHPHIMVMSDEIYEHILFDDMPFASFASTIPELKDRCLTVNGMSKAYAMTGWRLGYGYGPAALIKAMGVIQSQTTSGASSVSQAAALAALNGPQDYVLKRSRAYQKRRDLIFAALAGNDKISMAIPGGAFYAWLDCKPALQNLFGSNGDDITFTNLLLDNHGLALVPGSAFGTKGALRMSFAASTEDIEKGITRLLAATRHKESVSCPSMKGGEPHV